MQPVGPAPARHDAAGELVDDHHLAFLDEVVHFLLVQDVRLQQLVDDVELLALERVFALDRPPLLDPVVRREVGVLVDPVDRLGDVGHQEQLGVVRRHGLGAPVGQVDRVALLVQHEVERVLQVPHPLLLHRQLAVRDRVELHPLNQLLDPGLVVHLEQPLVLRHAELGLVQLERRLLPGLVVLEEPLGFGEQGIDHPGLLPHQLGHLAVERGVLVVRLVPHRARDDERRPRLVDEDRVHLVDDRVGVLALDPLLQREHHVVAQVVEAELVVGAVGDVGQVGRAALGRGGLGVVQAGNGEAEVLEDVAHPLGVAAGQVVVDRDQVRPAPGERVEIERQRGDEGLALAGGHLGDPPLMEHDPADELDVVGHHVPDELVPDHLHGGAHQPAAGLPHGGEGLGEELVEGGGHVLLVDRLELLEAPLQLFALVGVRAAVLGLAHLVELRLDRAGALRQPRPEADGLGLELVVAQVLELRFLGVDGVDGRLDPLALAVEPRPEDRGHQILDHSASKYKRCRAMYSATASGTQYRIDRPSRTRRRIAVAEISTAGTSIVAATRGLGGTGVPDRANTTIRASPGSSAASVPGLQLGRGIGPEQQGPGDGGLLRPEGDERLDGVGWPLPAEFRPLHREPRRRPDRQIQHGGPGRGRGGVAADLEGLLAGGDEPKLVEAKRLDGDLGHDQMAVMDGIERAAEEADGAHGGRGDRAIFARPRHPGAITTPLGRAGTPCPRPAPWGGTGGCIRRSPARPPCTRGCGRPGPDGSARRVPPRSGDRWPPGP